MDAVPTFFFFNDTATSEIYTLSLHDALPIWLLPKMRDVYMKTEDFTILMAGQFSNSNLFLKIPCLRPKNSPIDRKSTRLNSSHANISYAVFCLKKKTINLFSSR